MPFYPVKFLFSGPHEPHPGVRVHTAYSPAGGRYRAGTLLLLTSWLNAATSDELICFQAVSCWSSCPRNILKTSYCCWVGALSPACTFALKLSSCSLSLLGKARFASEPFMFTWINSSSTGAIFLSS